jgi:4-nitrophenyl phosphatase
VSVDPLNFDRFDAVLLDLDGTIYFEEHPLPGAVELICRLQERGKPYACLTNSTSSPERIAARLSRMGVTVDAAHIYTAAAAACDYVMEHFGGQSAPPPSGTEPAPPPVQAVRSAGEARVPRVFNLSTEGVHETLDGRVRWVNSSDEPCDVVIAGVMLNVYATDDRQRQAMILLRKGARLVGICADRVYPSPRGLEFGVGAMCAMLSYASGATPVFCGKPEAFFFKELCRRLGVSPERAVLLGDNLESDIAGAKGVGMTAGLVLTGVSTRADVERVPGHLRPDFLMEGLG